MLCDQVKQDFVHALIDEGISYEDLEEIVLTKERAKRYAQQLAPHVKLCVRQAKTEPVPA